MVLRALLAATAVLALAAPAAARLDSGAALYAVKIVAGKPSPAKRTVPRRGSVTWLNRDRRSHRIASTTHAWAPFAVRGGGQHALRFNRVGKYPYTIDGKSKGVIVVTGGAGGAGGIANGTTIFHYDVAVTGHAESVKTYTGSTRADHNGTETLGIDWTTKFANVTLKRFAASKTFVVGLRSGGFAHGGTLGTYAYTETRGDIYGPCQGTLPFASLGSHLLLAGSRASGRTEFVFWSQLDTDAGNKLMKDIGDQTKQACGTLMLTKSIPDWDGGDVMAGGLTYTPFNDLLELHAERKQSGLALWSPLSRLAVGATFSLDLPEVTRAAACGTNCQAQYKLRLHAVVRRH
jgi:plastocyanin